MQRLDELDRAMIAELRADARLPVSELATRVHVSRATAHHRLSRLVREGVIRRFTVEVEDDLEQQIVRAVCLIRVTGTASRAIARKLVALSEVTDLHTTNGKWDLVAQVSTTSLGGLDDALKRLRQIDGIDTTETSILLTRLT